MYELTVSTSFAAAHRLRNYQGKCSRLHGHTWRVEATVKGSELDETGMLIDFAQLKQFLNLVVKDFDHQNLNELEAFSDASDGTLNPTAENIASYIFQRVKQELSQRYHNIFLLGVTVWESDHSRVNYYEED